MASRFGTESILSANRTIESWLAHEPPEPVLEPELPIVDPHHHLWDLRTFTTEPHASFEQKVYLTEDIVADIVNSGHNVRQTVFAQCEAFYRASGPEALRPVGETRFVAGVCAMSESGVYGDVQLCAGIFGWADLRRGHRAEDVLRAHMAASANFRGIRSAFPRDLGGEFLDGYRLLGKLGLSFDNYSPDHGRLPALARLASREPDVTVIVNHLGGKIDTAADDAAFQRWRADIDAIAACPNAVIKCGGAQQRVGADWEPPFHMHRRNTPIGSEELSELVFPYYQYAIETFGPERAMFESNFPVDRECVSYRTLWNTFKRIARRMGLSASEKAQVFAGTARRVYRLPDFEPAPGTTVT